MRIALVLALSCAAFLCASAEDLFDSAELDDVGEDDLELLRQIEEKQIVRIT